MHSHCSILLYLERFAAEHLEVFHDGAESQGREEGQRAHDHHDADQQDAERCRIGGERACRFGNQFLLCQAARNRQERNDHHEAPDEQGNADGQVVVRRVGRDACEGRAVVARRRRVRVQDFREAVRPAVVLVVVGRAVVVARAAVVDVVPLRGGRLLHQLVLIRLLLVGKRLRRGSRRDIQVG